MSDTQTLIPLSQAAFELGLSWHQAWRLVLSREIPGENRGGRWFVDQDAVLERAKKGRKKR